MKGAFGRRVIMPRTVDDLAKEILADILADFIKRNLGSKALSDGYIGESIVNLEIKYCTNEAYPKVDFDLALKQLEESKFIATGPIEMHKNPPDSMVVIIGFYSKREYVFLTEKGYREAQKSTVKRRSPTPTVYISGGNFNRSQIGIGGTVNQTVTFDNQRNIYDLQCLVDFFEKHIDELLLDTTAKRKATAQISTIKAQLEDEPDSVIVTQAGRTLRNITEGAIGSLIATAAQPTVWGWADTVLRRLFA
jgi:hypothetical protein